MSVTVKVNGESWTLAEASLPALLRAQSIDPESRGVAVAVNGVVVPHRKWQGTALRQGDQVEIVKPFAGG